MCSNDNLQLTIRHRQQPARPARARPGIKYGLFGVIISSVRRVTLLTRHITLVTGHVSRDSAADLEFPAVGACHVWAGGHVAPE